jgi:uncharacterized protein (DUF488 family)
MTAIIYTIGHSTRSAEELVALLREAGVELLADIRTVPRSRFNPQFNTDVLRQTLAEAGIGYRHMPALGGLRHRPKGAPPSPNGMWRSEAFQAYADYALTPPFRAALDELRALARERPTAIMCAEAVWWQCHRRIVADYLLALGDEVRHIMAPRTFAAAALTPGAEPQADGRIFYPAAQGALL